MLPIFVHIDHMGIITSIEGGKAKTTAAEHPNAELWKSFWQLAEDLGGFSGQLSFEWCPGHDDGDSLDARSNR